MIVKSAPVRLIESTLYESGIAYEILAPQNDDAKFQIDIHSALTKPFGYPSFKEFLGAESKILIIVNDTARATPTEAILKDIMPYINKRDVRFLIATGSHPPPDAKQLMQIFGLLYSEYKERISIHNCLNDDEHENLGKTSFGVSVSVNRMLMRYEKIVTITSVEPHYFAGFTGGRKSIFPGIAGLKTITGNHKLAMDVGVSVLKLDGNPVHEDMDEALGFIDKGKIFSIQTVLDSSRRIDYLAAGDIRLAFKNAVEKASKIYTIPLTKAADIVIALVEPPFSDNLYQAHKAIENCKSILKPDGTFILHADCHGGIGQDSFYKLLKELNLSKNDAETKNREYRLGDHKAYKLLEFMKRAKIMIVTDNIHKELKAIGVSAFNSMDDALESAITNIDRSGHAAIIKDAANAVPILV